MSLKHDLLLAIAPPAASLLLKLVGGTVRIDAPQIDFAPNPESGKGAIIVGWHSRLLLGMYTYRNYNTNVLVSQSRDGELLVRTLSRFGFKTTRGSSSRGGIGALKELARLIAEGRNVMIAPDGPRGPREQAQMGVIQVAALTGTEIRPWTWAGNRMKLLNSWDQLRVPMPFSRSRFWWGNSITVPRKCTPEKLEEKRLELQAELNRLTELELEEFPNAPGIQTVDDSQA